MDHVVVIEDDPVSLTLIVKIVKNLGLEAKEFTDGKSARKYLRQFCTNQAETPLPKLIITDYDMPDTNGDIVSKLVKSNIELEHIPVLMISGNLRGKNMGNAISAGCDEIITKPIEAEKVVSVIKQLVPECA